VTSSNGRSARPRRKPHPYRDTALIYGGFAVVVLAIAIVTGGHPVRAAIAAGLAFLAATGWHWRAIRNRERGAP
jgi:hypothetical protein